MVSGMMAHISLLSNVRLTGLNPLNINKHDLVRRSTARSYLGTINQHDHVLRSNAWSFFSFRTTNQHDHVLRSNAWSCFSFRAINQHDHVLRSNAWSCFSFRTINHMTMSFVAMLGHISLSGMRPVGPSCVSGQDTLLKVAQY